VPDARASVWKVNLGRFSGIAARHAPF
jgi:hypothetical protein